MDIMVFKFDIIDLNDVPYNDLVAHCKSVLLEKSLNATLIIIYIYYILS